MGICDSSSNNDKHANANPRHSSYVSRQPNGVERKTVKYFSENTNSITQNTLILNNDVIVSDSVVEPEKVYQKNTINR